MKIRAILIDPFDKRVSEIHIEPKLDSYRDALKCDLITVAQSGTGYVMYGDDEGLLQDSEQQRFFAFYNRAANEIHQFFAGRMIIVGSHESGEDVDVPGWISVPAVISGVRWVKEGCQDQAAQLAGEICGDVCFCATREELEEVSRKSSLRLQKAYAFTEEAT